MWQLSDALAAKVEAAVGDRGVHASAQDGRAVSGDGALSRTRRRSVGRTGSDVRSGSGMLLKAVRKDGKCGRRGKKE